MVDLIEYHRCLYSAFAYVLFIHLYFFSLWFRENEIEIDQKVLLSFSKLFFFFMPNSMSLVK